MLKLNLHGTRADILAAMVERQPDLPETLTAIGAGMVRRYPKREIEPFEAAVLYVLARQYDRKGARILEIGTCYGWSALVMAHAAPRAKIVTCTPNPSHIEAAGWNLAQAANVRLYPGRSVDLLAEYRGPKLDMIFVDGDHKAVRDDLPWWHWLKMGGLMLHDDYCASDTPLRPCGWVYDALNDFAAEMHPFDVWIEDEYREGMAGFYRRRGEEWPRC